MPKPIAELFPVIAQTAAIYLFILFGLRVVGRRQLGQLNVIDLVVILILGSAVETAMIAGNTSLPAGLASAVTLFLINRLLAALMLRSRRLRRLVTGGPVLLVYNGHILESHLRRVGLTEADVLEAIREREQAGIEAVRFAVFEPDGEINVVPMSAPSHDGARLPG